jgi:type IV secretory pathway VirB6-like protein
MIDHNRHMQFGNDGEGGKTAMSLALLRALMIKMLCVLAVLCVLSACTDDEENKECIAGDEFGKEILESLTVPAQNPLCYQGCADGTIGGAACVADATNRADPAYQPTVEERNCLQECLLTCPEETVNAGSVFADPGWTVSTDALEYEEGDKVEFHWDDGQRIQTCEPNPLQNVNVMDTATTTTSGLSTEDITPTDFPPTSGNWYTKTLRTQPSAVTLLPHETLFMKITGSWTSCAEAGCGVADATPFVPSGIVNRAVFMPAKADRGDSGRAKGDVNDVTPPPVTTTYANGAGLEYQIVGGTTPATIMHADGIGNTAPQQRYVGSEAYTDPTTGNLATRSYVQIVITNFDEVPVTLQLRYNDPDGEYTRNQGGYTIALLTSACQAVIPEYLYFKVGEGGSEQLVADAPNPYTLPNAGKIYFRIQDPDGLYSNNSGSYDVRVYKHSVSTFASTIMEWVVNPIMNALYGMDCPDPSTLPTQTCPASGVIEGLSYDGQLIQRTCTAGEEVVPDLTCDPGTRTGGVVAMIYSNSIVLGLRAIGYAALLLYISLYGVGISLRAVKMSAYELTMRAIKVLIILQLISDSSWTFFSHYFFNIFIDGVFDLVNMFSGQYGDNASAGDSATGFGFLDETIGTFFLDVTWKKIAALMLSGPLGVIYTAFIISAMLIFLMAVVKAIMIFLFSMIAIGLMIIIFPFMLMFVLFGITRSMFDRWISQIFGFMLSPVLVFTVIVFFNEVIKMLLFGVLNYQICWDCAWEIEIPFGDLGDLPICIFKAYVISEDDGTVNGLDLNNISNFSVSFAAILAFVAVSAACSKIVGIADGLARTLAGQVNTAVKTSVGKLWEKTGMDKLETKVNALPQKIAKTVTRAGVQAGGKVAKGVGGSAARIAGGALMVNAGKMIEDGKGRSGALGERMKAFGKKEVVKGSHLARPIEFAKGHRAAGDSKSKVFGKMAGRAALKSTGVGDKLFKSAQKHRAAGDSKGKTAAKVVGKGLLMATIVGPLAARGIKHMKNRPSGKGGAASEKGLENAKAMQAAREKQNKADDKKLAPQLKKENEAARKRDEKIEERHGKAAVTARQQIDDEIAGGRAGGRAARNAERIARDESGKAASFTAAINAGDKVKNTPLIKLADKMAEDAKKKK